MVLLHSSGGVWFSIVHSCFQILFRVSNNAHSVCHQKYGSTDVKDVGLEWYCDATCNMSQRQAATVTVLVIDVMHRVWLGHVPCTVSTMLVPCTVFTIRCELVKCKKMALNCAPALSEKMQARCIVHCCRLICSGARNANLNYFTRASVTVCALV